MSIFEKYSSKINSERFNRGILPGLCRTIKANSHDAAVVFAASPKKMAEIKSYYATKKISHMERDSLQFTIVYQQ